MTGTRLSANLALRDDDVRQLIQLVAQEEHRPFVRERDRPKEEIIPLRRRDERRDRFADPRLDAGGDHRRERFEAEPRVLEPADDRIGQIERIAEPLAQPVIGLRQAVREPRLEVQRLEQLVRDSVAHDRLDRLVLDDRGDDRHEPVGLEQGPIDPEPDDRARDGDAHEHDEHPRGDSAPHALILTGL